MVSTSTKPSSHVSLAQLRRRHIWIIFGPAGCGKTTFAKYLAKECGLPYIEGDDYHVPSSIEKMSSGIPLDDKDRKPWLERLREAAVSTVQSGVSGVVVTCSALKKAYRNSLREGNSDTVLVRFVYLWTDREALKNRVRLREDHYMKEDMVMSQLECLEEPDEHEMSMDVIRVDATRPKDMAQPDGLNKVNQRKERDLGLTSAA